MAWHHLFSGWGYALLTSGGLTSACPGGRVKTLSECSAAARALRLSDVTAQDDGESGSSLDPPYCYFNKELGWNLDSGIFTPYSISSLKFNSRGDNTGPCTTSNKCVCRVGTYFA